MFNEYDKVKTLVKKEGYPEGTIGVIVGIYNGKKACEVEVWNEKGYPVDVVTYLFAELIKCE